MANAERLGRVEWKRLDQKIAKAEASRTKSNEVTERP